MLILVVILSEGPFPEIDHYAKFLLEIRPSFTEMPQDSRALQDEMPSGHDFGECHKQTNKQTSKLRDVAVGGKRAPGLSQLVN